jgi:tetratricopeptide (TPR) repeat protein
MRKDYDLAMDDLNESIKLDPANSLSYYFRASIKYELKDIEGTLSDYNEVIRLDPENALTYYNRAIIKSQLGDYFSAIEDYDEVSKLNPNNVFTYYNRGLVKNEIGNYSDAIDDFSKAIEIYPDFAKAYMARGSAKSANGDTNGAIADNNTAAIKINAYQSQKGEGEQFSFADTTKNFAEIIALNSDFGKKLSSDKIVNGRIQDRNVEIELEPVFRFVTSPEDSLVIGENLYFVPQLVVINHNLNSDNKLYLSDKSLHSDQPDINEKIRELDNTGLSATSPGIYHLFKSIISSTGKNYNTALLESDMSINYKPLNAPYYFNRANIRLEMIELIASVGNTNNYLSMTGDNSEDEKPGSDPELFNYEQVIADYEKCILYDPDFAFAYYNLANVKCLSRDFESAVEYYDQATEKMPDLAEAYFNRGLTLIYLSKTSEACIDLGKAGELGLYNAYSVIKRYCNEERP